MGTLRIPVLLDISLIMMVCFTMRLIDTESTGDIMTCATCGEGDAHSSGTPDLTFGFCEDICATSDIRGRTGDCPPIEEGGTPIIYVLSCIKWCAKTPGCESFTHDTGSYTCFLHQCQDSIPSVVQFDTFFRKVCQGQSCQLQEQSADFIGNCSTEPEILIENSRFECLRRCDRNAACQAVTLRSTELCFMFNCTASKRVPFSSNRFTFYIRTCTVSQFDPVCIYQADSLGTRGECDSNDDYATMVTSLEDCQHICSNNTDCKGITYEDGDVGMCYTHNTPDCHSIPASNNTSYHTKQCEPFHTFTRHTIRTDELPVMPTCPLWRVRSWSLAPSHDACAVECDRLESCAGVRVTIDDTACLLHNCSEPGSTEDQSLQFYTKTDNGTNFTDHGPYTVGTCRKQTAKRALILSECLELCNSRSTCQGVTFTVQTRYKCTFYSCGTVVEVDVDRDFTFYSKDYPGEFSEPVTTGQPYSNIDIKEYDHNRLQYCEYLEPDGSTKYGVCSPLEIFQSSLETCGNICSVTPACNAIATAIVTDEDIIVCSLLPCIIHSLENTIKMFYKKCPETVCNFVPVQASTETCTPPVQTFYPVTDEVDCIYDCENTTGCLGVTIQTGQISCYLQDCKTSSFNWNTNVIFLSKEGPNNCLYTSKGDRTSGRCSARHKLECSLSTCEDKCSDDEYCRGFDYYNSSSKCHTKACDVYAYESKDDMSFYSITCTEANYKDHGKHRSGDCKAFQETTVQSMDECIVLCTGNRYCNGVTIDLHPLGCLLHKCDSTTSCSIESVCGVDMSSYAKICQHNNSETTQENASVEDTSTAYTLSTPSAFVFGDVSVAVPPTSIVTAEGFTGIPIGFTHSDDLSLVPSEDIPTQILPSILSTVHPTQRSFSGIDITSFSDDPTALLFSYFDTNEYISPSTTYPSFEEMATSSVYPSELPWTYSMVSSTLSATVTESLPSVYSDVGYVSGTTVVGSPQPTEPITPSATSQGYVSIDSTNPDVTWYIGTNCRCACQMMHNTTIDVRIDELRRETKVNRSTLSSFSRRLTSAVDTRTSAKAVGAIGVIMFIVTFGIIVLGDVTIIGNTLLRLRHTK